MQLTCKKIYLCKKNIKNSECTDIFQICKKKNATLTRGVEVKEVEWQPAL